MIVVDTNVLSELMTRTPRPSVQQWMDLQDTEKLFFTTISIGEIEFGLCSLPAGHRQQSLSAAFAQLLVDAFDGRVLPFDLISAQVYGSIRAKRKSIGRPISSQDAQIAAIARSLGFAVATRNVKDFQGCGVELLNPFDAARE